MRNVTESIVAVITGEVVLLMVRQILLSIVKIAFITGKVVLSMVRQILLSIV